MRFEDVHAYLAQHCFFFPLPHVSVGIQNVAAISKNKLKKDPPKKTPACIREIQVHKLWTKVYSQNGLTRSYAVPANTSSGDNSALNKLNQPTNDNSSERRWHRAGFPPDCHLGSEQLSITRRRQGFQRAPRRQLSSQDD